MTDVTIDRLHASYNGFDRADVERLDGALAHVVDQSLNQALTARHLPDLFAVCIRSLDVVVNLDPDGSLDTWGRRWAQHLADAIVVAIRPGTSAPDVPTADHGDLVIYDREIDVVRDVVVSVASNDRRRLWAWNQTGIWSRAGWPTFDDVATLLRYRPTMAGSVLAAARRRGVVPLSAAGWRAVASAVAATYGVDPGKSYLAADEPTVNSQYRQLGAYSRARSTEPQRLGLSTSSTDVSSVVSIVPRAAWIGSAPEQRIALAVLALMITEPILARSRTAIDAVAGAAMELPGPGQYSAERNDTDRPITGTGSATPKSSVERPGPAAENTTDSAGDNDRGVDDGDGSDPESRATSEFGGVMFLIQPLRELGVVDATVDATTLDNGRRAEPLTVLAEIVSAVTGVDAADPIVDALVGLDRDDGQRERGKIGEGDDGDEGEKGSIPQEFVVDQAQRIVNWLEDRTGESDLDWIWSRPATINRQPGWIEIEMSLDSVEVRVRTAALDLDPGFVWWLGSVVRFRYV